MGLVKHQWQRMFRCQNGHIRQDYTDGVCGECGDDTTPEHIVARKVTRESFFSWPYVWHVRYEVKGDEEDSDVS